MKSKQRKALLAVVFASHCLSLQLPTAAAKELEVTPSIAQQLTTDPQLTQELEAYYLLGLAKGYLNGFPLDSKKSEFINSGDSTWLNQPAQFDKALYDFAKDVSSNRNNAVIQESPAESARRRWLTNRAVEKAISETEKCSDGTQKIILYLVALAIFQSTGNGIGAENCNKLLEQNIKIYEGRKNIEPREAIAVSHALNSMANNIIPMTIPDLNPSKHPLEKQPTVRTFTNEEFERSEKLMRRATATLDRLPDNSHERRKGHRDLALWYQTLGKHQKADEEKKTLFILIGREDEELLYARPGSCGHLVWWENGGSEQSGTLACGMG